MRSVVLWGLVVLFVLHHDIWFWGDATLLFGFLPIGLAYHAVYCLVVFVWMILLVRFAWPADLEEAESGQPSPASARKAS